MFLASNLFSGSYPRLGVLFDGANDWATRGADLTSNADGKKGIVSFWFKRTNAGGNDVIYITNGIGFSIGFSVDDDVLIQATNAALSTILLIRTNTQITDTISWHHFMASWDLGTTTAHLYVDNSEDLDSGAATITDDTIDYTRTNHRIGATFVPGNHLDSCIADLYLNFAEYLDLSVAGNRTLLYGNYLGDNGAAVTGSRPIILMRGPKALFGINFGYGGNFSITGALEDCGLSSNSFLLKPPTANLSLTGSAPTIV